jgi:NTP pyrophosphatase (non-canonical NTP hydrolase)
MTLNEYQILAQRTSPDNNHNRILNGVMGLAGESGECIDYVKKNIFQSHDIDHDKLIEELGDVLWYCAELAAGLGVGLEEVAQWNIDKLRRRYPDGFDPERSVHRDD